MRLIDADELKELFREVIGEIAKKPEIQKDFEHMVRASAMTIQMIDDAPTIEAEPVRHGRWIIKSNPENGWYQITCSECGEDETTVAPCIGFMPNVKVIWDYCPNCGAKMDGGIDNETD